MINKKKLLKWAKKFHKENSSLRTREFELLFPNNPYSSAIDELLYEICEEFIAFLKVESK